ncbi:MAG: choice-of-anchor A family protein, partial [Bacteroidales bacterium]|nr:choice-of-anchor A family protein [Bacteroidales bacterium]
MTGTATDNHPITKLEAKVGNGDWTDITASLQPDGSFVFDPGVLPAGPTTITVRATGTTHQQTESTTSFTVNSAPVPAIAYSPSSPGEGDTVSFDSSGTTDIEGIYAESWLMSDGSTVTGVTASEHYWQDGLYPVSLTVIDTAGSVVTTSVNVPVSNLAPAVTAPATLTVNQNESFDLVAAFTDPGILDTHTATIAWAPGDSMAATVVETNGSGTATGSHAFADPGVYTVTVTVTDDGGAVGTAQVVVTVQATNPQAVISGPSTVLEGSEYPLALASAAPVDSWDIQWGDGTSSTLSGSATSASHVYADNGAYAISATATNAAGVWTANGITVSVGNVAPTVTAGPDQSAGVNALTTFHLGTFTDPGFTFPTAGTSETFTATVDWGDGTIEAVSPDVINGSAGTATTGSVSASHTFTTPDTYTVRLTVSDDDGGTQSRTLTVTVAANAPVVLTAGTPSGPEGSSLGYTATFTDADPGDTHTAVIAWGDGTTSTGTVTYADGVGTVSGSHIYADNGTYPVAVTITDQYGLTGTATSSASITNVAPSATPASAQTATVGQALSLGWANFTDPGFTLPSAGTSETFTVSVNWDDGVVESVTPNVTNGSAETATTGSVLSSHTYTAAGSYTVTVTITDDDGGSVTVQIPVTVTAPAGGLDCYPAIPVTITGVSRATSTSESSATTNDSTLVVSGTGQPGAVVTLTRNGTSVGSTVVAIDGRWQVDTTGTTLSAGNYSFSATQAPLGPLGEAGAFNGFIFTSATNLSDVQGRLAAGGAITVTSHGVGTQLTAADDGRDTIIAGGSLSISNGQVYHGNAVYGTTGSFTSVGFPAGYAYKNTAIDFTSAQTYLTGRSDAWAAIPATGTTTYTPTGSTWAIALTGSDPSFNAFSIDGSKLWNASGLAITAPAGSTVLINVTGTTNRLQNFQTWLNGVDKQHILFNFAQTTALTITSFGVLGSVLAPRAAVSFSNGFIDGQLVAQSVSGNGELHWLPLLSACPTLTSATYTVTVAPETFTAPKFFVVGGAEVNRYSSSGSSVGANALADGGTATGIVSNTAGSATWVVTANTDGTTTVTQYDADGSVRGSWRAYGVTNAQDVATNGTDVWVLGRDAATNAVKVFRYTNGAKLRSGGLDPASSFTPSGITGTATGLATDGQTIFVVEKASTGGKIWAYDTNGNALGGSNGWRLDGANGDPTGVTLNPAGGNELWVVDKTAHKVFTYASGRSNHWWNSGGVQAASSSFALATGSPAPEGIADPPVNWVGGSTGFWDVASNWSGGIVPTTADDVTVPAGVTVTVRSGSATANSISGTGSLVITGGTLTLGAASTVGSFAQSGGTLAGAGDLTVTGTLSWTSGTMSGAGTTIIAAGGTLALSGYDTRFLVGRTLRIAGTGTWTDSGSLYLADAARLDVAAGGTLDLPENASLAFWYGSPVTFTNAGTVTKTTGTGTFYAGVAFVNNGQVSVGSGTLNLSASGSGTGTWSVASGATLAFAGGAFPLAGSTVTGAGVVAVTGGTVDVGSGFTTTGSVSLTNGSLSFSTPASLVSFTQSGGTLAGAGDLTVTGTLSWTSGTMSGAGTTIIAAGGTLALSGYDTRFLVGRTLRIAGTGTWTDSGSLYLADAA